MEIREEKTSSFSEEKEEGASPQKIIFSLEEPNTAPHEIWKDFLALLVIQGNEETAARKMIGRLIGNYHAERVSRCYQANRDLIYEQVDSYGYFKEILKQDKKLNRDEGEVQTALREARYYHLQMHSGLDFIPTFNPLSYVNKWPILQKYIDEISSGAREIHIQEKKSSQKESEFNKGLMEQARFYGRI